MISLVSCQWCGVVNVNVRYLVCCPVHPSLSTWVDVDEHQALHHVWAVQLFIKEKKKKGRAALHYRIYLFSFNSTFLCNLPPTTVKPRFNPISENYAKLMFRGWNCSLICNTGYRRLQERVKLHHRQSCVNRVRLPTEHNVGVALICYIPQAFMAQQAQAISRVALPE